MKENVKKAVLIIFLLVLAGSSLLGWAKYKKALVKNLMPVVAMDSIVKNPIDTIKVNLLKKVYSKLNLNKNEFLIAGAISIKSGVDTSGGVNNAAYVFSRKGTSFYFKLGATETINANGLYLYIDHSMKKVLIAKGKSVVSDFVIPELSVLLNTVEEEGFKLTSTTNGDTERISLNNPYHLSCKEYTVVFNKLTLKPNKLFVRLSSTEDPDNSTKDNTIDFRIGLSTPLSKIEIYTVQKAVKKGNSGWSLTPEFKGYELINTF